MDKSVCFNIDEADEVSQDRTFTVVWCACVFLVNVDHLSQSFGKELDDASPGSAAVLHKHQGNMYSLQLL